MKIDLSDILGDLPSAEALLELMGQDKKVVDGKLRFILVRDLGQAFVTSDVARESLVSVLTDALAVR
jgi:3-dehydroquinate synthase